MEIFIEQPNEPAGKNLSPARKSTSDSMVVSGLALLDEFACSVDRDIDYKKEREESRDMKFK